ncbi:hypothetical protein [Sphingomonas sp. GC_Shp_5]|nr:hypothetical protein [Sphingomonas sp. GC_Shp_5]
MDLSPPALRARFAELGAQRASIIAVSGPLREERDAIARQADEQLSAKAAEINEVEADLLAIDQEAAMISRALGGKTGEPTEDATDA